MNDEMLYTWLVLTFSGRIRIRYRRNTTDDGDETNQFFIRIVIYVTHTRKTYTIHTNTTLDSNGQ